MQVPKNLPPPEPGVLHLGEEVYAEIVSTYGREILRAIWGPKTAIVVHYLDGREPKQILPDGEGV